MEAGAASGAGAAAAGLEVGSARDGAVTSAAVVAGAATVMLFIRWCFSQWQVPVGGLRRCAGDDADTTVVPGKRKGSGSGGANGVFTTVNSVAFAGAFIQSRQDQRAGVQQQQQVGD